ncbi:MAG: hypothetical protein M3P00_12705, partial [Gemmatimonadota bacterium]|nr:hypothetical protein [Gemmatimonadota bacterium]
AGPRGLCCLEGLSETQLHAVDLGRCSPGTIGTRRRVRAAGRVVGHPGAARDTGSTERATEG